MRRKMAHLKIKRKTIDEWGEEESGMDLVFCFSVGLGFLVWCGSIRWLVDGYLGTVDG